MWWLRIASVVSGIITDLVVSASVRHVFRRRLPKSATGDGELREFERLRDSMRHFMERSNEHSPYWLVARIPGRSLGDFELRLAKVQEILSGSLLMGIQPAIRDIQHVGWRLDELLDDILGRAEVDGLSRTTTWECRAMKYWLRTFAAKVRRGCEIWGWPWAWPTQERPVRHA
jgi:hypothetical protein